MARKTQTQPRALQTYKYVECRTLGHSWKATEATKRPAFGYYMWLECSVCGMVRKDTINALGRVGARSYAQPDTYRNPEHTDRSDYRLEMLVRLVGPGQSLAARRREVKQS